MRDMWPFAVVAALVAAVLVAMRRRQQRRREPYVAAVPVQQPRVWGPWQLAHSSADARAGLWTSGV